MKQLDLWMHQFCLACEKQAKGSTYCSESCSLADLEDSFNAVFYRVHPAVVELSALEFSQLSAVGAEIAPSSQEACQLSRNSYKELRAYACSLEKSQTPTTAIVLGSYDPLAPMDFYTEECQREWNEKLVFMLADFFAKGPAIDAADNLIDIKSAVRGGCLR